MVMLSINLFGHCFCMMMTIATIPGSLLVLKYGVWAWTRSDCIRLKNERPSGLLITRNGMKNLKR